MANGTVTLPAAVESAWAGIDAGATLWKLCKLRTATEHDSLQTASFDSGDLTGVHRTLTDWGVKKAVATGGGAAGVARESAIEVQTVPEFEAWAAGAELLAQREGLTVPRDYLVVSLGTGTSILRVREDHPAVRVGGTALGGGTLLGLGRLLLGVEEFRQIVALAADGDRRRVDLLVGDVYASGAPPLAAELNASSFAKLESRDPADLAHALCGLIGENIALMAAQLGRQLEIDTVLYCGSTLDRNEPLRRIVVGTAQLVGLEAHVVEAGAYAGAMGALSMARP